MKRLRLVPISAVAVSLAVGVLVFGAGNAFAAAEVTCQASGKHTVSCPKKDLHGKRGKQGKRGPRGVPGPAGPAGPAGAPGAAGGAGSGLSLNFNAFLTPNRTKELAVGNFTITAASDAFGSCVPISIRVGLASRVSVGSGGAFSFLSDNSSQSLTDGASSNMFTAVSENGASTVSGIVGSTTVGSRCLVSGYVTGV